MRGAWRIGRALRCLQRLRDDLSAEHAPEPVIAADAAIQIGVDLLDIEQIDEVLRKLGGRGQVVHQ